MIWSRFDPLTYQQHSRRLFHQATMTTFSFEQTAKMVESLRFVTQVESSLFLFFVTRVESKSSKMVTRVGLES